MTSKRRSTRASCTTKTTTPPRVMMSTCMPACRRTWADRKGPSLSWVIDIPRWRRGYIVGDLHCTYVSAASRRRIPFKVYRLWVFVCSRSFPCRAISVFLEFWFAVVLLHDSDGRISRTPSISYYLWKLFQILLRYTIWHVRPRLILYDWVFYLSYGSIQRSYG
jgi:hypothetical protein